MLIHLYFLQWLFLDKIYGFFAVPLLFLFLLGIVLPAERPDLEPISYLHHLHYP